MAYMQDDAENSRTSLAGRKRGFEESSTNERIHKHARQESSYESSTGSNVEQEAPVFPLTVVEKSEVAEVVPDLVISQPSPIIRNESKMTSPSLAPTTTETEATPQQDAQIVAGPPSKPSWNSGIQKGLRTSFSSKKARPQQMALQSKSLEVEAVDHGVEFDQHLETGIDDHDGTSFRQSLDTTHNEESSDLPAGLDTEQQGMNPKREQNRKPKRRRKAKQEDGEADEEAAPLQNFKQEISGAASAEEAAPSHKSKQENGEAAGMQGAVPFRKLSAQEKSELSGEANIPSKKGGHVDRKERFKLQRVKTNTAEVATALDEYGWPLPETHAQMINTIQKGQTYYPRNFDRSCRYTKSNIAFDMTVTLDSCGLPIQFPDISFNEWAVQVLIANPKSWLLVPKVPTFLSKALVTYVNFFYLNHYGDPTSWVQKIKDMPSPDHGADTVADLIDEAARRISSSHISTQQHKKESNERRTIGEDIITISDEASDSDGSSSISEKEDIKVALTTKQLLLQQRYYPSVNGTTTDTGICLACGQIGHTSTQCPALLCVSCGGEHSTMRCPERQTCQKCRAPGHARAECPEKLGVPKSDVQCEFCDERSHSGSECHLIWRTFVPMPADIRTVQHIPIDCYSCGASSHFGPDCGLRIGHLLTGGLTWSISNLNRYVDPASERRALSAGVDYSIPPKKVFSIKGKANDPIVFDDSSDDGQGFIRPKVQTAERGHIRFDERQDNRPKHNLPRRPASPVAPYRNPYDGGLGNGEEPRYGMSSDRDYYAERPQHGSTSFRPGPADTTRSRNKDKPANRGSGGGRGRGANKRGGRGGRGGPRH